MEGRARYSSRRTRPRSPTRAQSSLELQPHPTFGQTKQLRICHGIGRENQLDNGFFPRAPVWPGCIRGGVSIAKYLISETHRLVTSTLDSLEVVSAKHRSVGYNHTFINLIYNVPMTYSDVLEGIFGFIERHEKRSRRLHLTGLEIRICWRMKREMPPPSDGSREFPASSSISIHGYQGNGEPLRLQPVHQKTPDLAIFVVHAMSVVYVLGTEPGDE